MFAGTLVTIGGEVNMSPSHTQSINGGKTMRRSVARVVNVEFDASQYSLARKIGLHPTGSAEGGWKVG